MVRRRTEKLIERFIGSYKIKKIVSPNVVELKLPSTVKIHSVVNVSRIQRYIEQVERKRKEQLALVIIEKEKGQEVKRILNKQWIKRKDKYLVWQKGFIAESNTWEGIENLENTKEAVKEFEKEYWQDIKDIQRQEQKEGTFKRGELPGRFMVRKLFGWLDKKSNEKYWARLKRNWRRQKEERAREWRTIETIKEKKEEIEQENLEIKEWAEKDNNKMGNICNLYYKL